MDPTAKRNHPEPNPDSSRRHRGEPLNAITVDVEDWAQSCLDPNLPLTDRFRYSTQRVLALLARHDVKGTFFVLGLAAKKDPDLVREICLAGHEVQSHGYGHRLIHTQTPAAFRQDVERSKRLLEDICGRPITGYRAPAFSITHRTLWALDVLVECGFKYDSSIFPVRMKRYGIAGRPRIPHRLTAPGGGELVEVPVASYRRWGRRWPVGGGGYFRLLPYRITRQGVAQLNRDGHPATIYMHPHEFDPEELRQLPHRISWKRRVHQGLGRKSIPAKIDRFLKAFRFSTLGDMLDSMDSLPRFDPNQKFRPRNATASAQSASAPPLHATEKQVV